MGGVLVISVAVFGCESNVNVDTSNENLRIEIPGQTNKSTEDGERMVDALRNLKTGPVTRPYYTSKMRDLLIENGIDPYQEREGVEDPDRFKWLLGIEAWREYDSEWEQKNKGTGESLFSKIDPGVSSEVPVTLLSQSGEPAFTEFVVSNTGAAPANGSVTVNYLGVQVTTNYTSSWNAIAVANTIANNINNNSNIKVSATVSGTTVRLKEKRDGCNYNGNMVAVSHTNGTHITVNNDTFYMKDGHDGEGWCPPPPPPPSTVSVDWGSFINTNSTTGGIQMGSYTWASVNLYYISVSSHSYKDGFLLLDQLDECYNCNQTAAGLITSKNPVAPSNYWQQFGQHIWWFHPDDQVLLYTISYKWTNF